MTAFSLECKKVFSSKGFWIFAVVILVLCIIVTATFRSLGDLIEGMDDSATGSQVVSAEEAAEIYRAELQSYYEGVENGTIDKKLSDTTETYLKNMIAICEFCSEHDLNLSKLVTLGSLGSVNLSSSDYVTLMSQMVFAFVSIMAIVLAAKTVTGESEDGTMRMQLTRPLKRGSLLTAKTGAVFVTSMALGIVLNVLFMIFGVVFFDGATCDVLVVDAYQNVAVINPYAAIVLMTLFNAVTVALVIQFTVFVGNFVNKTGSLAIPLVMYLFADTVASLLYNTGLPFVGLFTNLKWLTALTPTGAPIRGMSIYSMMAVTAVWFAAMTAINYISFAKRDFK